MPAIDQSGPQVIDFLRQTLDVVRSELERSVKLQGEMAERISQHTISLVTAFPEQGANDATAILTALQSDDRIRQRHEGLVAALSTLAEVLEETANNEAPESSVALSAGNAIRRRWISRLLASQCLEELEESFARRLDAD